MVVIDHERHDEHRDQLMSTVRGLIMDDPNVLSAFTIDCHDGIQSNSNFKNKMEELFPKGMARPVQPKFFAGVWRPGDWDSSLPRTKRKHTCCHVEAKDDLLADHYHIDGGMWGFWDVPDCSLRPGVAEGGKYFYPIMEKWVKDQHNIYGLDELLLYTAVGSVSGKEYSRKGRVLPFGSFNDARESFPSGTLEEWMRLYGSTTDSKKGWDDEFMTWFMEEKEKGGGGGSYIDLKGLGVGCRHSPLGLAAAICTLSGVR